MAYSSADGSVIIDVNMDVSQAEKRLEKLRRDIKKAEEALKQKESGRDGITKQLDNAREAASKAAAEIDRMKAELAEAQAGLTGGFNVPFEKFQEYTEKVQTLPGEIARQEKEYEKLAAQVEKASGKVDQFDASLEPAKQKIADMKAAADVLTQEIEQQRAESEQLAEHTEEAAEGQNGFRTATEAASDAMDRLLKRVKGLIARAFVFTLISRALTKIRQTLMRYIKTSEEARQAIANMKGALLTLAQPIIEIIIPAFTLLLNVLSQIVSGVARFVSFLFGKSFQQSKESAKALYNEANALEEVGEAAEEAAGSLAGFDEINTLNTETANKVSSGGSSDEIIPDFDGKIGKYKDAIDELLVYLSGALLVLGTILVFSGANIPLGLGLMVLGAGALAQAISENWGDVDGKIMTAINNMLVVLGSSLLVLGAILCFSGANIPLGLGMILLGASMLATEAAINWNSLDGELQSSLAALLQIIGAFLAVIGVFLAVTGHLALGIGLIIAGVALFATGEAAMDGGPFLEAIRSKLEAALEVIAVFLSVVGLLLIVTGHFLVGLALLIAGVAILKYTETEDDSGMTMVEKVKTAILKTLEAVAPIIAIVGLLLIVTGNFAIGLALLIAGIAIFQYAQVKDDEGMTFISKVKTALLNALTAVSPVIAIIGLLLLVTGHFLTGLAMLISGIAIFSYSMVKDDNGMSVQDKITSVLKTTAAIAGTFLLVLGLILLLVPAMWPTAIAMIAAGGAGLVTAAALDDEAIKNKLKSMWEGIKSWWDANAAKFFTLEYWQGLGKDMVDGLLDGLNNIFNKLATWASNVWSAITGAFSSSNAKASIQNSAPSASSASVASTMSARSIPEIPASEIPHLAKGTVIPANREFLAVLGDQKRGTNVEAPLETIKQALAEVMSEYGGNGGDINITVDLDGRVVARNTIQHINDMTRQAGKPVLLL